MVVDQVDIGPVGPVEAENDPPVGPDRDAPKTCEITLERVQAMARKRHVVGFCHPIELSQNAGNLGHIIRGDAPTVIVFVEPLQAFMANIFDQANPLVNRQLSLGNSIAENIGISVVINYY
jgi:hypothetical protein